MFEFHPRTRSVTPTNLHPGSHPLPILCFDGNGASSKCKFNPPRVQLALGEKSRARVTKWGRPSRVQICSTHSDVLCGGPGGLAVPGAHLWTTKPPWGRLNLLGRVQVAGGIFLLKAS